MQSVPVPVAIASPTVLATRASNTANVRASVASDSASIEAHSLSGQEVCSRMLIVPGETAVVQGGSPILRAFANPTVAMHLTDSAPKSRCFSTKWASLQPVRNPTPWVFPACSLRRSSKKRFASTCGPKSAPLTLYQKAHRARARPPPISVQPSVACGTHRSTSSHRPQAESLALLCAAIAVLHAPRVRIVILYPRGGSNLTEKLNGGRLI